MSRAEDDTYVDYTLLSDRELGDAVAEKVLGWTSEPPTTGNGPREWAWEYQGLKVPGDALVSWWGAGLVIDMLRSEGYSIDISDWTTNIDCSIYDGDPGSLAGDAQHESPIRAILEAALRLREAT